MRRVCDACNSRKVRCDRNNPCGNCIDQNATCTRSRGMRRLPKRDLQLQRREASEDGSSISIVPERRMGKISRSRTGSPAAAHLPRSMSRVVESEQRMHAPASEAPEIEFPRPNIESGLLDFLGDDAFVFPGQGRGMNFNMNIDFGDNTMFGLRWMSNVPLTENQTINHAHSPGQGIPWTKQQALESALSIAGRILGSMEERTESAAPEQERYIPSVEFLGWMLTDIGSPKFGSFISDYFRHISKQDLKSMGVAMLSNTNSPEFLLDIVCVNSIAFKFLNATLSGRPDDELSQHLRQAALRYRESAQSALREIPLLTKPSLRLLQALLCGIFLHQGTGDTSACRELAKSACRVAMDIGLYPGGTDLTNVSEAEYYCFMWCYMLDRSYAWKFGGQRALLVDGHPDDVVDPRAHGFTVSELMLVYLDLAKVQDEMIPFLNDPGRVSGDRVFDDHGVGVRLIERMEGIRRDINQIKAPSPAWKGLDPTSETATLDFAFHCILTNLLHLRQISYNHPNLDPHTTPGQNQHQDQTTYLDSARKGLQALITLCGPPSAPNSPPSPTEQQKTVAYLHWTLLFYPITACIALFCNTVATSHPGDFHILITVSNCLARIGELSKPVAAMQRLLGEFVELSRCFFFSFDRLPGTDMAGHGITAGWFETETETEAGAEAGPSSAPVSMAMAMTGPSTTAQNASPLPRTDAGFEHLYPWTGMGMSLGAEMEVSNSPARADHDITESGLGGQMLYSPAPGISMTLDEFLG